MFERRNEPLASTSVFVKRVAVSLAIAGTLIACVLGLGIMGYQRIGGFSWIDSLLEASMIVSGMGPVNADALDTTGKVFASIYALFCGLVFIATVGIVLAPLTHRMLHRFHIDEDDV